MEQIINFFQNLFSNKPTINTCPMVGGTQVPSPITDDNCNSISTVIESGIATDIQPYIWMCVHDCGIMFLLDNTTPDNTQEYNIAQKMKGNGWSIVAFDSLFSALRKMYMAYQEIFGVMKPGISVSGLDGNYIVYYCTWTSASGLSAPQMSGAYIGPAFIEADYENHKKNLNTLHQIMFYETTRNFMKLSGKVEYSHSDSPSNYGWMNQGWINILGCLFSKYIGVTFWYGSTVYDKNSITADQFIQSMLDQLNIYLINLRYTFDSVFNAPTKDGSCRLPWNYNESLDNLTAGLLAYLYINYGNSEFSWLKRFMRSFLLLPWIQLTNMQGALDNYYLAASRASNKDLIDFFAGKDIGHLRWNISQNARNTVNDFINQSDNIQYSYKGGDRIQGDLSTLYLTEDIDNYVFYTDKN